MYNVTYIPSASVSDSLEDWHCLPCLADPPGTSTVMTTIPQLCTGSCVKTILYTTKGPTHKRGNKTTLKHERLIPILIILHAYQIQANATKITRTLQDIKFQKGWHSIWAIPLATYKKKTPRIKTVQITLHDRLPFGQVRLPPTKTKQTTSRLTAHYRETHQPTCNQLTNPSSIPSITHQY